MPGVKRGRRGFGSAQSQYDSNTERMGKGNFIRNLFLTGDGDMARFSVVTSMGQWGTEDGQVDTYAKEHGAEHELLNGEFHRYPKVSPKGKTFYVSRLCGKTEDDEGELSGECDKCDEEVNRSTQFLIWVFLYAIYHRARTDVKGSDKWVGCNVGNITYYREDVNGFVLWQDGFYMSRRVQDKVQEHGTLMDREWAIKRFGAKGSGQVTYELVKAQEHEIDADMIEQANKLPDLDDVASGVTETLDGSAVSTKAAQSAEGPVPETNLESDDSFGEGSGGDGDEINFDDLPW